MRARRPGGPDGSRARQSRRAITTVSGEEGRRTFRSDTFGSEAFWGNTLELHRAIAGDKHGVDVLDHYDQLFKLGLTESERTELGEYLKSL